MEDRETSDEVKEGLGSASCCVGEGGTLALGHVDVRLPCSSSRRELFRIEEDDGVLSDAMAGK